MYIELTEKDYYRWNEFCLRHHWFWHTTWWQQYLMNSKFKTEFKNHSFFHEIKGLIKNIVPLIQEGDVLYSPGIPDERDIIKEVKKIAEANNCKHIQVDSDIKSYLNTSGYTCILDLYNIKPTKGHKSAIKKGEKYLTCKISEDIDAFREYYWRIAKKKTRPKKSFDILGKWIKQGFGTLMQAFLENKTVGYIYILHCGKYAYYFMSASSRAYKQYNVTHFLQSIAFEILKNIGVTHYEMGEQVFNSLFCQPTDKERSISKFKRSFGGEIVIKPKSEYFLDQKYMIDVYAERLHKYWERENYV